jgi:carbamate kinase
VSGVADSSAGFPIPDRLLVAVGGNAIHPADIRGTSGEQVAIAEATGRALLPLMQRDNVLVITHGNGPGVGKVMMRQALARERVEPVSLDICVANSQGGIAYVLLQALEGALRTSESERDVVCVLTRVEVDDDDPAFHHPRKPVGYFYGADEARALNEELRWNMVEDAGRGWRHVVASPAPRQIIGLGQVEALAAAGAIVIAGGGGGIPVVRADGGGYRGVEAVIDKDLTSAMMANALGMTCLLILTAVSHVALDHGTPRERALGEVSVGELKRHLAAGQFPEGSMGPKVRAAIEFVKGGGQRAIITHLDDAFPTLCGSAGTHVLPDGH